MYLLLKVAANSVNHLKFVAGFVQLEPGSFALRVGDHVPVMGGDSGQESALSGAFEEQGRQLLIVGIDIALFLEGNVFGLAIGAFDETNFWLDGCEPLQIFFRAMKVGLHC